MIVRPQIAEIKKLVVRTFIELGVPSRCLFQMEESSVIRSGTCAARTYAAGDLQAVWFLKKGLIRFSDTEGNTLRVIRLHPKMVCQVMPA
jgi:hypothetical protein